MFLVSAYLTGCAAYAVYPLWCDRQSRGGGLMSDLSDLSDLSDICAAKISRAGKNKRSQYPWVKNRGAPQYR